MTRRRRSAFSSREAAEAAGNKLSEAEKAGLIAQVATDTAFMIVEMLSQVSGKARTTA